MEFDCKFYVALAGLSSLIFWIAIGAHDKVQIALGRTLTMNQVLIASSVLKFVTYVSVILWTNSVYYVRAVAIETDVESWEFQKEQVKLTLWIVFILILSELPLMLDALGAPQNL